MSDLALTVVRLAFLALLWSFVVFTVLALNRDLRQPAQSSRSGGTLAVPSPSRAARRSSRAGRRHPSKLVVTEGELSGTVVPLGTSAVTIGRAPDSTLVIEDDYASSSHARITLVDGEWVVEDLGSTNGTWIERTRITEPTVLTVGSNLRVGRTTIQARK
jgi:hypothetical protein